MVSLLPSKIKDFCHLPRQREAKYGGSFGSEVASQRNGSEGGKTVSFLFRRFFGLKRRSRGREYLLLFDLFKNKGFVSRI